MNRTQRSFTPIRLEKGRFFALRELVYISCDVQVPHLQGIGRRPLCLLCSGVPQTDSARAHVPKVAAVEILLDFVVVKDRRKRRVSITLRFSRADSPVRPFAVGVGDRNGPWSRRGGSIEEARGSGEARIVNMASRTSYVFVNREAFVVNERLTQRLCRLRRARGGIG